jgi:DNA-directed RNA polymerase subunit RPC12/RpoP
MTNEPIETESDFEVICAWCGVKIRNDQTEESYRTCLECFYRIVADQLNSQRRPDSLLIASDR